MNEGLKCALVVAGSIPWVLASVAMAGDTAPQPTPAPPAAPADAGAGSFWERHVDPIGVFRPRYEYVDTDGRSEAWAATMRTQLGLLLHGFGGFSALAEYEGVFAADRDSYQAASVHGLGQNKSVIPDPESNELNRAWLGYTGFDTDLKAGRQRIRLGNDRFISNVDWRQNETTYDAFRVDNRSIDDLTLTYAYVNRANRPFGSGTIHDPAQTDFTGNSHLANVTYAGWPVGKLSAYGYWLDLHNDAGDAESNQSFGASLDGAIPLGDGFKLPYYAEYAYQTDAFDSPLDYAANYFHLKLAADLRGFQFGAGYESLGGDNGVGFKTPLGLLHGFNGYNDVFLVTPPDGLGDFYLHGSVPLPFGFVFKAWVHWFGDDGGSFDYGREFDALLVKQIGEHWSVLGTLGLYEADSYSSDEQFYAVQVQYRF